MAVLPRFISAGNRPADGPLLGGGRSAPGGRTVRSYLGCARAEPFLALLVVQNELRTVRSMGADGPPLKAETGVETW